jgi:hypothetical protein
MIHQYLIQGASAMIALGMICVLTWILVTVIRGDISDWFFKAVLAVTSICFIGVVVLGFIGIWV